MTTATIDPALLPKDEDVHFYREHGYHHSRKLFVDDEIDAALDGSERFYAGDFRPPPTPALSPWQPGERTRSRPA